MGDYFDLIAVCDGCGGMHPVDVHGAGGEELCALCAATRQAQDLRAELYGTVYDPGDRELVITLETSIQRTIASGERQAALAYTLALVEALRMVSRRSR